MCLTLSEDMGIALQADDEYMISDYDLFVNKYVSVPRDMGQLNCAALIAGIVKGALMGAGCPARQMPIPIFFCLFYGKSR